MQQKNNIFLLALLASLSALSNATPTPAKVVRMPFTKRLESSDNLHRRDGKIVTAPLSNDLVSYDIKVNIGSPAQSVVLQLDTGSSDLFVLAPGACNTQSCTCPTGGCTYYDSQISKTAALLNGKETDFDFSYGSGEVEGFYITDSLAFSNVNIKDIIIGVAKADRTENRGIMGVGLPAGESSDIAVHAGVVQALYNQGSISSRSYSLFLDSSDAPNGEIIFGGIDSSKYTGKLTALPIVPSPDGQARLTVAWSSLSVCTADSCSYDSTKHQTSLSTNPAVLLDSGTTLSFIEPDIFQALVTSFKLVESNSGTYYGPCSLANSNTNLKFGFGTNSAAKITVPTSQLIRTDRTLDNGEYCEFGIQPGQTGEVNILGDTFLTSAYVYYDFDDMKISLAQAKVS